MRFWLACVLGLVAWPAVGHSQNYRVPVADFIPHQQLPMPFGGSNYGPSPAPGYGNGGYGNGYGGCNYGSNYNGYGPGYSPGYGYGYNYGPGAGFTFSNGSPFGFNYSGFSSVNYGVPGFGVGYSSPLYGNSYYGSGWGYSRGYSAASVYVPNQLPLQPLPQWMIDEANLDPNPPVKAKPIAQTHRSLVQPSTPEAQLRSLRMQAAGDRLLATLDYSAAERSYAKSLQAAPDRPDPYMRLAIAKAARGDYRGAVAYLKQMVDVDPTYPARADSLNTLFGHRNGVSKVQLKQHVADWTKVDVRDPDRIFLLGIMLFLDGDDRFRTLLDTDVKLEGEQPHLKAFLDTVPARDVATPAPTPDEIDALAAPQPAAVEATRPANSPAAPILLPAQPEPPAP